ncbi:MAG: SDR family NAD(P)-dependent oxidoreductase [Chloroflexi bacterium]|nr:SDR family NAD(P)-dependent oxidoreductase [Chloroflexota bacterium]
MDTNGVAKRSVIITGGGSGIGRATALRFARQGDRVLVADLNPETASAVVDEISAAGGTAVAVTGDLSDQAVVDQVVNTAVDLLGGVDVLVNNAGIMDHMSACADVSDAEWDAVLRVNLTAPFLLTRAALPHMLAKGRGVIVNTASEAGLRGSAAGTAYTVSKHGVVGLTRSIAIMYRDAGIRANAIAPGGTATNISVSADPAAHGPRAIGAYMSNVGRVAAADEQAAAIVFLASDAASNINGVILPVDNGWSAV